MVWATARRAPNIEYFEFEAHPDHKIEYTARLDIVRINSIPKFMFVIGCGMGRGIHSERARRSDRVGAIMKRVMDVFVGRRGSFVNSFAASAKGWRMP